MLAYSCLQPCVCVTRDALSSSAKLYGFLAFIGSALRFVRQFHLANANGQKSAALRN